MKEKGLSLVLRFLSLFYRIKMTIAKMKAMTPERKNNFVFHFQPINVQSSPFMSVAKPKTSV